MISIRKYTPNDQPQVILLFQLNVPKGFDASEEKDLKNYLNTDSENYFVAELDSTIVGCGGFNVFEKEKQVRISWDFFHPDSVGKGFGTTLLNYRIYKIQKSFPEYSIVVRTSQFAFQFYEKRGFQMISSEKDFWAKGYDLFYLEFIQ